MPLITTVSFQTFGTLVPPLLALFQTSIGFDSSSERVLSMCTLVFSHPWVQLFIIGS